jgi:hypothetical protein
LGKIRRAPRIQEQAANQFPTTSRCSVQQASALASDFQMFVGGIPATAAYAGFWPRVSPASTSSTSPCLTSLAAMPFLTFTLNGVPGTQTLYIAVQN